MTAQRTERAIVIGAGVGGLTTALLLAARGLDVTVLERAAAPGGKMRQVQAGGGPIDAGPTVFTMRWVFDEIFAAAGLSFDAHVTLKPLTTLARHAWESGARLDLFADIDQSVDAIGAFAGAADAAGYRRFCARAQAIHDSLKEPFLESPRPGSPLALVRRAGVAEMLNIAAFSTLWQALGRYFSDPRLRQLFARYATYSGSSPYLAPATLMLIAHVERSGVWLIEGGMHRLAQVLAERAVALGATIRYEASVEEIGVVQGRAGFVRLAGGARIDTDAVVVNADSAALAAGCFGRAVASAVPPVAAARRSLSALTWARCATVRDFPLHHHTVFFGDDYRQEFTDIFDRHTLPAAPTVYICAQDRDATGQAPPGAERLLILVNAPPYGDTAPAHIRGHCPMHGQNLSPSGRVRPEPDTGCADGADRTQGIQHAVSGDGGARCMGRRRTGQWRPSAGRGRRRRFRACIWRGDRHIRARGCRWRRFRADWRRRR